MKKKIVKVSENFEKFLSDIKINRIKIGMDKKMMSSARITEALLHDPILPAVRERLIKMPNKEDLK
jgi:hypothetical protein